MASVYGFVERHLWDNTLDEVGTNDPVYRQTFGNQLWFKGVRILELKL